MASRMRNKREKREQEKRYCNCIVAVFQVMVACQSITFISGQGYLYPDSDSQSQKLLQDVNLFSRQQGHGVTSESQDKKFSISHSTLQIRILRFEPPFLDFDAECVGMPRLKTVYIHNPSKEKDLQLSSISAKTSHFHSSFFESKVIPPGGNTSFEVVFLARVIGNVENTLFINTLHGTFPYQVFGVGIPNPFKLRPYLGAKVPLNSTFSPLISMHNPTSQPLQVTELYSSSGYLQLQLPQGQHEGTKDLWEIAPYETKEVIRARFLGQVEANHTAFIRIKTSNVNHLGFHILPVEVEVSSAPGIYSSSEMLDFGTLRTQYDGPQTLPLFLLNSGDHEVIISSISLLSPNPAVSIQFKRVKLRPSQATYTLIANITYSAASAKTEGDQKGILVVKTKEKSYSTVEIPFMADLLDGTLGYDEQSALFHVGKEDTTDLVVRKISLSNTFSFPVILQDVSLSPDASSVFKAVGFAGPFLLPPSSEAVPFSVEFNPKALKTKAPDDIAASVFYLTLLTNASKFSLPLHTYSGTIMYEVLREDTKKIDYGIMGTLDKRQVLLALYNRNPAKVTLLEINNTLTNVGVRLVSLTQGSGRNLTDEANFQLQNFDIPSNSCAVFEVTLVASDKEEEIIGALNIFTKYQEVRIPMLARVVVGTLTVKPERVKFPPSFPGLVVQQALTIVNTFAQNTKLESVRSKNGDKRFYYKKMKNQGLTLEPNKKAKVGKVYFDARQTCKPDRCYVGLPTSTTIGHHWLTTLALGVDSVEFDTKRYKELRQRWKNLQNKGLSGPNTTLILDTDVVQNVEVPVQATLYWPTLLDETDFDFPLTHVGRKSVATLTVLNPADLPVVVQVLPLSLYPHPPSALEAFGWSDKLDDDSFITQNGSIFHLLDPRQDVAKDSMTSQMVWLEYTLNGKLNHSVVNIFLDPGQRIDLKVEFVPYDDQPKSTVILLRNNLTILDSLVMHGSGAYEHLTLGGKMPNRHSSILRFKLTKDILKDCTRRKSLPSFTVRKWFHANNTGLLPIHITSVTVNGSPCEGYGFRVLDCDQFILKPNSSKKLEIAFTPDFTSYLVLHKLKLVTAQGNEMVFTLNVTLPPYMLPLCQKAMPRPSWEPALYYFITVVMIVLFLGILLMSYLEAINIWEPFVRLYEVELQQRGEAENSKRGTRGATPEGLGKRFDLRNIATSFISTVTSSQQHNKTDSTRKSTTIFRKPLSAASSGVAIRQREPKLDISQQTDPHPDFPPLHGPETPVSSGLRARFSKSCAAQKGPCRTLEKNSVNAATQSSKICPTSILMQNKHELMFSTVPDANSMPPGYMDEIERCARLLANHKPKEASKGSRHEIMKLIENKAEKNKPEVGESVKPSENGSHENLRKVAKEKRKARSESNRNSRASTSSSTSADTPEPDFNEPGTEKKEMIMERKLSATDNSLSKSETEPKRVRGKKLRKMKLSRKQIRAAQAKEREDALAMEKLANAEVNEKAPPARDEQSKTTPEKKSDKATRQTKPRASSMSSDIFKMKEAEKVTKDDKNMSQEPQKKTARKKSPEPISQSAEVSTKSKRRSNSCSVESERGKNKGTKVKQITIYKNQNAADSRSSSSQEISESSSSEGAPLWDTPCQRRDPDEDLRQISKQTHRADLLMGDKKSQKEGKRTKGTASPVHLTSSSRSSSYSSVLSTASSSEGNQSKQNSGPQSASGTPSKRLSRSVSDTTGGTPTKMQLRRRNPYPPVSQDRPSISPSHSFQAKKESINQNAERFSPQLTNAPVPQARKSSSPSASSNLFGKNDRQDRAVPETSQPLWTYQPIGTSYTTFGQPSFNLENLIGNGSSSNQVMTHGPSWGSPFSDGSSLYSTPSPPKNFDSPNGRGMSRPRHWSASGSPLHTPTTYGSYDAPPGTPTTPGLAPVSNGLGWGEIPSPTSSTGMTTHSIWSVSNAVTMDENRAIDECDPLGLKDIWTNSRNLQNSDWTMH